MGCCYTGIYSSRFCWILDASSSSSCKTFFWNRHIIHHSSEEFNLSCALRQSISTIFRFSAILMIPAALLGIPAYIFAILAPIHLFMQFWYHTRVVNKMGILEYILVTPSHHRVHHAINPEYLDKNYSQIFIIWDKMFNTFQPELDDVKPVYGDSSSSGDLESCSNKF